MGKTYLKNIENIVTDIRRFKKHEIINIGSKLLWKVFENKHDYSPEYRQIISAYAPNIIILGMSTANNFRNHILDEAVFYNLCHDYLGVKEPINDLSFRKQEINYVLEFLKQKEIIPIRYLTYENINTSSIGITLSRGIRQQNINLHTSLYEFYRTYDILMRLDAYTNGHVTSAFESLFGLKPLYFMRAAFALFTLGRDNNGSISLEGMPCEDAVKEIWGIDTNICKILASKISYAESLLWIDWYKNGILKENELYQKYYPTPLYKNPLIDLDLSHPNLKSNYLIPSPVIYMKAIRDSIFSKLIPYMKKECGGVDISSKLGDALEDHFYEIFKNIFGKDRVQKITKKTKRTADFIIGTEKCFLIIETKTAIGGYSALSTMKPIDIAGIWSRLYEACEQCSSTLQEYNNLLKPIIPIILFADDFTEEITPFTSFASSSHLLKDLGLSDIEFLSLKEFEDIFSRTSVEKFIDKLLNKNKELPITPIEKDIDATASYDIPAYDYKYLKEIQRKYFFLPENNES